MLKAAFTKVSSGKLVTAGLTGAFALFMGIGGLYYADRAQTTNTPNDNNADTPAVITPSIRSKACSTHVEQTVTGPNGQQYHILCP
jgi:hypothetical protein